jgi:hypothetical protein
MIEYLSDSASLTEPNQPKLIATTTTTNADEGYWMGKTNFLLKKIIRPYLAYILKFATSIK